MYDKAKEGGFDAIALDRQLHMTDATTHGGALLADYIFDHKPFKICGKTADFQDRAVFGWGMQHDEDRFRAWIGPGEALPKHVRGKMVCDWDYEHTWSMYAFTGARIPKTVEGLLKLTAMPITIESGDGLEAGEEVEVDVECVIDHGLPQPSLRYKRGEEVVTEHVQFVGMREDDEMVQECKEMLSKINIDPLPSTSEDIFAVRAPRARARQRQTRTATRATSIFDFSENSRLRVRAPRAAAPSATRQTTSASAAAAVSSGSPLQTRSASRAPCSSSGASEPKRRRVEKTPETAPDEESTQPMPSSESDSESDWTS